MTVVYKCPTGTAPSYFRTYPIEVKTANNAKVHYRHVPAIKFIGRKQLVYLLTIILFSTTFVSLWNLWQIREKLIVFVCLFCCCCCFLFCFVFYCKCFIRVRIFISFCTYVVISNLRNCAIRSEEIIVILHK